MPTNINNNSSNNKTSRPDWFLKIAVLFAFVVLLGYASFIVFMSQKINVDGEAWPRLTYLFAGIEAIVFSAVGFIFGREVNRARAENAEQNINQAIKDKEKAQKEANEESLKSKLLIKKIDETLKSAPGTPAVFSPSSRFLSTSKNDWALSNLASIANTVQNLYPNVLDLKSSDMIPNNISKELYSSVRKPSSPYNEILNTNKSIDKIYSKSLEKITPPENPFFNKNEIENINEPKTP